MRLGTQLLTALALASVVVTSGCSCELLEPPDEERDGGPEPDASFLTDCFTGADVITGESIAAADEQLDAFADGTVDVALSPLGCTRFERVVEGGHLVSARITKVVGYEIDPETYEIGPLHAVLARWERDAAGVLHGGIDADDEVDAADDDFFEIQEIVDESRGTLERSWYDASSRELVSRFTLERQADGSFHQHRDALVGGTLTATSDGPLTPELQSEILISDEDEAAGCVVAECAPEVSARLHRLSRDALRQGMECLGQHGQDPGNARAHGLEELFVRWRSAHRFLCTTGGCGFSGQFDIGAIADGRTLEMAIDATRSDALVTATIGHEWSHGYIGPHSDEVLGLIDRSTRDPGAKRMLDAVDPVYACQAFCFGRPWDPNDPAVTSGEVGIRNACSCAACYGVRACHPLCAGEDRCAIYDDLLPIPMASESVGASCEPGFFGERTWHIDMEACRSSGCTSCRSWSLSCNPTCQ